MRVRPWCVAAQEKPGVTLWKSSALLNNRRPSLTLTWAISVFLCMCVWMSVVCKPSSSARPPHNSLHSYSWVKGMHLDMWGVNSVFLSVCVCICAHALWPAWILMQNSTVFCLLLVIVILCTGIREAACMAAAALWSPCVFLWGCIVWRYQWLLCVSRSRNVWGSNAHTHNTASGCVCVCVWFEGIKSELGGGRFLPDKGKLVRHHRWILHYIINQLIKKSNW